MDDAGGCMISIMALAALKELGLVPRRTLQTILWTSEESGLWGVEDFARQHENILADYSAVFGKIENGFAGKESSLCN
jgi:acetylornithine deacetylase/succinyl-diaminopimelate desuccinylase-like protein